MGESQFKYFFIPFKGKRGVPLMNNKLYLHVYRIHYSLRVRNNLQAMLIPQALLNRIHITGGRERETDRQN